MAFPTLDEAARNVSAALGLLRYDRSAAFMVQADREAVIRSLWVGVLVAPLFALYRLLAYDEFEVSASTEKALLVETLRYVVAWLSWPVLSYELTRMLGLAVRWPRYIVLMNWIQLPAMILVLGSASVAAVAPDAAEAAILTVTDLLLAAWSVLAARLALDVGWIVAIWLVALEFTVALSLSIFVVDALGVVRAAGA